MSHDATFFNYDISSLARETKAQDSGQCQLR